MNKKVVRIINLIIATLIAVALVGFAFAWFSGSRWESKQGFNGSSGSTYFAGGSGSQTDPYLITDKYHMYNLAWLQNTGKFVEGGVDKKYYFKIDEGVASVDMGDLWLPPIGTDAHPFIGDFDGNGKTIKNLKITTDESKLQSSGMPTTRDQFSNAVGMFGKTGGAEADNCQIHNFILDNPTVEVATNTTYADAAGSNKVAGLAVGHVAKEAKVYSIGVLATESASSGTQLLLRKSGYSTFNSIIGELAEGASSSVTGGGHGIGGSGSAFGASFDVDGMYNRLIEIKKNKNSTTPAWRLPNLGASSNESITLAKLAKLPFTVDSSSTYAGADAKEVIGNNNIGYLLGNQNKVYNKNLTFGNLLEEKADGSWTYSDGKTPANGKFPRWLYKTTAEEVASDTYSTSNGFAPLSQAEFGALPQSIQDLVPATSGTVEAFNAIRLSQTYQNANVQIYPGSDDNGRWSPHGQISWMGKTYGEGFSKLPDGVENTGSNVDYKQPVVDENGDQILHQNPHNSSLMETTSFYSYTEGIALPNCGIWFKPSQSGKIRFVMYAKSSGDGFALLKGKRTSATKENPFIVDYSKNGTDVEVSVVGKFKIPKKVLFYFEYDVRTEDIEDGRVEYWLMEYGSGGAYFVYMDLGASAAADQSTVDKEKTVSAVDFIYDGVSISTESSGSGDTLINIGDFIVGSAKYNATQTSVYFEKLNAVLEIVFIRKNDGSEITIDVGCKTTTTGIIATNPSRANIHAIT